MSSAKDAIQDGMSRIGGINLITQLLTRRRSL